MNAVALLVRMFVMLSLDQAYLFHCFIDGADGYLTDALFRKAYAYSVCLRNRFTI